MPITFMTDLYCDGLISKEDYEWAWNEHLRGVAADAGTWVAPSRVRIEGV